MGANAGWHYKYKEGDTLYYAVERGREVRLIEIQLWETSNPFLGSGYLLLEPSNSTEARQSQIPLWPADKRQRTQEYLATLAHELPHYRTRWGVLYAAQHINRDIGAFHPAWVIGTDPLVVAFRQGTAEPEPYADLARRGAATRPTTTPGVIEILNRSGEGALYDRRARHVKLVTDAELECEADTVLIFPKEMTLPWVHLRTTSSTQSSPQLRVLHLREPMSLRSLMRDLTESNRLEQQAESVKDVPVRPP